MPNQKLADAANAAIDDPAVEAKPGYCQRYVRQVMQRVYGSKYDEYFQASAKATAYALLHAGLAVDASDAGELETGDVLYKTTTAGPFGHVGIYVGDDKIASNSSTSLGRIHGAKGYRT